MATASRCALLLSLLLCDKVHSFAPTSISTSATNVKSEVLSTFSAKAATQLFSGMMGGGNGYGNQGYGAGNQRRREEIVAFQVTTVFDQEELLARERDQPMFTPAVRRDIYRILKSPYNPSLGGDDGRQMFGSVLLAKSSDRYNPNAAWDTFAFASKGANPSGFTILDDEQMLEAISSIGKITPVALAITQAFEAYLSQIVQLYWAEPEASQLSVEFLVAFGNELTQRLDINNRIRSTRLTPQEIEVLCRQPFANFVDNQSLDTFQGETMRGMNMAAIRSAPPPEIIPLAGNYGNSDLGMNARANTAPPAYNSNSNNPYSGSGNVYGNNANNPYGANNSPYGPPPPQQRQNNPYGGSQPPPPQQQQLQNPLMPQPGYIGPSNSMDFRQNDNNRQSPYGRSYGGSGNTYSGNTDDSRNFGRNNSGQSYGNIPDQRRPLQGNVDGYNYNNSNDGIRSNSKFRTYDNPNRTPTGQGTNGPPPPGNNNSPYASNNGPDNSPYGNNNNNNQNSYVDNRGPPPPPPQQSGPPSNYGPGYNMNPNGPPSNYGPPYNVNPNGQPPQQSGPPSNYGSGYNMNANGQPPSPPQQSGPPSSYGSGYNMNPNGQAYGNNNTNNNNNGRMMNNGNNNNSNNNRGLNTFGGNGLYESARRGSKRDNALWDDSPRGNSNNNDGDKGWYENF